MRRVVKGPGSIVSGTSALCAALCAESSISMMLAFIALAAVGVTLDVLKDYFANKKRMSRRAMKAQPRRKGLNMYNHIISNINAKRNINF